MSEIKEQLTIDQAANLYAPNSGGMLATRAHQRQLDFKAGAEWQREQDQALLQEAQEIINVFIGNTKTGGYRDYLTEFNIKLLTHLKNLSK